MEKKDIILAVHFLRHAERSAKYLKNCVEFAEHNHELLHDNPKYHELVDCLEKIQRGVAALKADIENQLKPGQDFNPSI